jgi:hypothetical protein
MSRVSQKKRDKIAEQILHYLFTAATDSKFISQISQEVARDEEFVKEILKDLEKKKVVVSIDKNKSGEVYTRRRRWRLSNEAFDVFSKHQEISAGSSRSLSNLDETD